MNILVEKCDHPMCFHSRDFTKFRKWSFGQECMQYIYVCVCECTFPPAFTILLVNGFVHNSVCSNPFCVYSARTVKSIVRLTRILYCYDCKTLQTSLFVNLASLFVGSALGQNSP
jgi:hypothetical protein